MAAINHGGTFYRLDKSSQSGDCGEANVMALHLASKQVMPFAFAVKGIPFGYSLTQVKAQSNCIRAGSFSPFPSCHASGTPGGSSTASTHNPYKEVILSRRPFNEGVKGCTRGPQPRYGLAVLPMTLLSRTNARPSERDLNNRFSYNLADRFGC